MRSRDSGLPLDTRNTMGTSRNVFENLPAREGPSSALFENSRNLVSSSCGLGPSNTGNTMEHGRGVTQDPPRFHQGVATLNPVSHPGGTHSHKGMMDYPRFPISEMHLENSRNHWNFQAGKSTSRLRYVQNQQFLTSQCTGSKKLRQQSQWTIF